MINERFRMDASKATEKEMAAELKRVVEQLEVDEAKEPDALERARLGRLISFVTEASNNYWAWSKAGI